MKTLARSISISISASVGIALVLLSPAARADEFPLRWLADLPRHTLPAPLDGTAPAAKGDPIPGVARTGHAEHWLDATDVCFLPSPNTLTVALYSPTSVRTQRLVESPTPMLEFVDAWVDDALHTHFVRRIEAPVVPVARGPQGAVAYAYRAGDAVVVLAATPSSGSRRASRSGKPECNLTQLVLSPHGKRGDEGRVPFVVGQDTQVWLEASLSRVKSDRDSVLSVSFSSPDP